MYKVGEMEILQVEDYEDVSKFIDYVAEANRLMEERTREPYFDMERFSKKPQRDAEVVEIRRAFDTNASVSDASYDLQSKADEL
jgi:hypothetical protein